MKTVAVLMSTYNGEKYIREQIDSILEQKNVDIHLYIRDDGSKDNTITILEEYKEKKCDITLLRGENIGVGNSFMNLLYQVGNDFDYYAFADQDDVWLPDKIPHAIEMLEDKAGPTLYVSNQMLVDQELNELGLRYSEAPDISYKQILCQNKISGCTMVWNRALNDILTEEKRRPSENVLRNRIHDVWVAMVAAVTGKIIYDNNSYILYRQHDNNVVGIRKTNRIHMWIIKLRNPDLRNGRSLLCKAILTCCSDLIEDKKIKDTLIIVAYYNIDKRLKANLIKRNDIIRYSKETPVAYRLKVLFNLL